MILAVAALADGFASLSLEVDAGGVEEDQLEFSEQIEPVGEQPLLDQILGTSRSEWCLVRLFRAGQLLTEPGHGPVEMVELQSLTSFNLIILLPLVGGAITARVEETMKNCEEDGPLDGELIVAALEELTDHMLTAGLLPEPLEDQSRTNAAAGVGREFPWAWSVRIRTDSAKRAPETSRASSCPLRWSSSSRPRVAMTRCRERPPSQRFSTTWR